MGDVRQFDFTSCGDGNGVIHWMGTKKGTAEWSNPHTSGEVEACMSSVGQGEASMVVDSKFNDHVCFTNNEAGSWIGVDMKSAECNPSIYTLAHRGGLKDFYLRSWVFQGSADGIAWDDLDDRTEDQTMCDESLWCAYAITPTEKFYRFFRIRLKPQGNTRKTDCLIMCCFELYGKARNYSAPPPPGAAKAALSGIWLCSMTCDFLASFRAFSRASRCS